MTIRLDDDYDDDGGKVVVGIDIKQQKKKILRIYTMYFTSANTVCNSRKMKMIKPDWIF